MKFNRTTIGFVSLLITVFAAKSVLAVDLARVNGRAITEKDLEMALGQLNEGTRESVLSDKVTRRKVLQATIDQELLAQTAEKEKIDQLPDYRNALEAFRKNTLSTLLLQKKINSQITDAAAKNFYEVNRQRYSTDSAHVLHILVSDEAQARDLVKRAKVEDFQSLAETYSKDPSVKNNRGDMGWVTWASPFVKDFKSAIFSTNEGSVSGPIQTDFGYHVVKVIEQKPGKSLEFSEVEFQVRNDLREHLSLNYLSSLKKEARVAFDEKAVDTMRVPASKN